MSFWERLQATEAGSPTPTGEPAWSRVGEFPTDWARLGARILQAAKMATAMHVQATRLQKRGRAGPADSSADIARDRTAEDAPSD